MKREVLAVGAFFILGAAYADSVTVYHEPYSARDGARQIEMRFNANTDRPELGRAWIEVVMDGRADRPENDVSPVIVSKNVAGLRFDSEKGEIVYERPGIPKTVCAKIDRSRFLFWSSSRLVPTGNCELEQKVTPTSVDDGFHVEDHPFLDVVMNLHPGGTEAESEIRHRMPASIGRP